MAEPQENIKHRHIQDLGWAVEGGFSRDSGSQKGEEVRTAPTSNLCNLVMVFSVNRCSLYLETCPRVMA